MAMTQVMILMGSDSDLDPMSEACKELERFGVGFEIHVSSAHRTPDKTRALVEGAEARGIKVFICGAGASAHLAGVVAAHTTLPVIGVPMHGHALAGADALYATVQMPRGVPVATVAIDGAMNAALLVVQMLAITDAALAGQLADRRGAGR